MPRIAGGFPSVGALLHQPCRGSVAEGVGCHVWPKASIFDGRSEPFPDRPNRLATPLNSRSAVRAVSSVEGGLRVRAVGERAAGVFWFQAPLRASIEHATGKIDPTMTLGRLKGRVANGAGAGPSVESDQNKTGNVLA